MRIKRTGTGMYDTSYTIAATARNVEVPKIDDELPPIKEYFKERYSALWTPSTAPASNGASETEVKLETAVDDLF